LISVKLIGPDKKRIWTGVVESQGSSKKSGNSQKIINDLRTAIEKDRKKP
jgi:hypothetical protein